MGAAPRGCPSGSSGERAPHWSAPSASGAVAPRIDPNRRVIRGCCDSPRVGGVGSAAATPSANPRVPGAMPGTRERRQRRVSTRSTTPTRLPEACRTSAVDHQQFCHRPPNAVSSPRGRASSVTTTPARAPPYSRLAGREPQDHTACHADDLPVVERNRGIVLVTISCPVIRRSTFINVTDLQTRSA